MPLMAASVESISLRARRAMHEEGGPLFGLLSGAQSCRPSMESKKRRPFFSRPRLHAKRECRKAGRPPAPPVVRHPGVSGLGGRDPMKAGHPMYGKAGWNTQRSRLGAVIGAGGLPPGSGPGRYSGGAEPDEQRLHSASKSAAAPEAGK